MPSLLEILADNRHDPAGAAGCILVEVSKVANIAATLGGGIVAATRDDTSLIDVIRGDDK